MKKAFICIALLAIAQIASGCMFFPRTYDGSESFYAAHPEYSNPPAYMQNDPDADQGK